MTRSEFFDQCVDGSIREKVADMMSHSATLSKLVGEDYYKVEDEICHLVEDNKYILFWYFQDEFYKEDLKLHLFIHGYKDEIDDTLATEIIERFKSRLCDDDNINESTNIIWGEVINSFKDKLEIKEEQ